MLLSKAEREAIAAGRMGLVLRRWKRPSVKAGGTLVTAIGQLAIDAVERIDAIAPADAICAGYPDAETAASALAAREGDLYRIAFHLAGPDPRLALRESAELDAAERQRLAARLARLAARPAGPWTGATLKAIAAHPGVPARELAALLGRDRDALKTDIRKLKALGLTISLETGYRLSPRGLVWLAKTG
ncbi:hypothetical protein VE25_15765 [Devosia geojensis]|uniref:Uncharacterized protein n=1 Tax=Devosia geojensis TaxID=443610 RepID=A0A0F5FPM0_9HYPH|nr:HTH domain-containing protein [Devosia geojensis]KKB10844.1 hypothetical protein VE25_15765 [Devosia geojensis]